MLKWSFIETVRKKTFLPQDYKFSDLFGNNSFRHHWKSLPMLSVSPAENFFDFTKNLKHAWNILISSENSS